jgi:hypothetical protein
MVIHSAEFYDIVTYQSTKIGENLVFQDVWMHKILMTILYT